MHLIVTALGCLTHEGKQKTTSKNDMRKAVQIIRATIVRSRIPSSQLQSCMQILCAIGNAVADLQELTWESLTRLLSFNGIETSTMLLEAVTLAPQDRHTHTVCGALTLLAHIVIRRGDDNLPVIAFEDF